MMRKMNRALSASARKQAIQSRLNEDGASELITMLVVLPIILWLIFSLIDISMYMQARSSVTSAARDGARMVAIYGGNNNPQLKPPTLPKNGVQRAVRDSLYNTSKGRCVHSQCKSTPRVTCTPDVTTRTGEQVQCTVTYRYKSLYSGNIIPGFRFVENEFTVQATARSEVGGF